MYSLHLVPHRASTTITVALGHGDALAGPSGQTEWPNWVRVVQALEPYLMPAQRRTLQCELAAGKPVWLSKIALSDGDLDRLGF